MAAMNRRGLDAKLCRMTDALNVGVVSASIAAYRFQARVGDGIFDGKIAGKSMVWNSVKDLDRNAIYADQLPRVYNYFRFRLGCHTDIEELTSRTFEKAWRARAAYSNDLAAFSTWLFKIAQNVGTDYLRSERTLAAPTDCCRS